MRLFREKPHINLVLALAAGRGAEETGGDAAPPLRLSPLRHVPRSRRSLTCPIHTA